MQPLAEADSAAIMSDMPNNGPFRRRAGVLSVRSFYRYENFLVSQNMWESARYRGVMVVTKIARLTQSYTQFLKTTQTLERLKSEELFTSRLIG